MQSFFASAEISTLNCKVSTNFQENLWNEGVSFVETLDQSTKGFFMFEFFKALTLYYLRVYSVFATMLPKHLKKAIFVYWNGHFEAIDLFFMK